MAECFSNTLGRSNRICQADIPRTVYDTSRQHELLKTIFEFAQSYVCGMIAITQLLTLYPKNLSYG